MCARIIHMDTAAANAVSSRGVLGPMPRIASLFALLLVCSPLAAAETVTAELPVSDLRLVPDPYAGCSVFSGATKAFAVCAYAGGGQPYRYDLESDGSPILSSRDRKSTRLNSSHR